jgi:acyl-CoA reductase-like NAD-dependent aldehyde dehydrogenase
MDTVRRYSMAVLESLENGAPVRQAGAFQIGFSIAHLRYFADLVRTYAFERTGPLLRVPTLASGLVRREPVGVCAAIVPWNFPLLLAMWKIGPALAAGNTLVIKPDERTPLTLLEFAKIAQECGLPPGVLNVVPGDGPARPPGLPAAAQHATDLSLCSSTTPEWRLLLRKHFPLPDDGVR